MNTWNFISGKSRQYYIDARYLGRDNLYKFSKDDMKFTFIPLKKTLTQSL